MKTIKYLSLRVFAIAAPCSRLRPTDEGTDDR